VEAELDLVGVRFFGNTAGGDGGGIYIDDSDSTIVNSLFSGNEAAVSGGGMFNVNSSTLELINSTFSGNKSVQSFGGGLGIGASTVTIDNSIFWGNVGGQVTPNMSTVDISYTNLEGGCPPAPTSCDHLVLLDPKFRRSPDPGIDGSWGTADDDYGDLKLIMDSPAIDAGDNNSVPADVHDLDGDLNTTEKLPLDLEGLSRFKDVPGVLDTGNGTPPIVDMGAFENQFHIYHPLIFKE
jgi:predicted outer membrane repeat protein